MLRSGISVEVCHVLEEGTELPKKALKKEQTTEGAISQSRTKKSKKRKRDPSLDMEDEGTVQSKPEGSQNAARGRKPRKRTKKSEPERHTTPRYSSPEL